MVGLVAFFAAGHHFGFARDSDVRSIGEAMLLPIVVFGVPMAGLTFGVMLPYFAVCRRFGLLRRRWTAVVTGVVASAPTFVVFFLVGRLLNRSVPRTLLEDIQAVLTRPQRLPIVLGLFAVAGVAFALVAAGKKVAPDSR
jgi:hypothetical protein